MSKTGQFSLGCWRCPKFENSFSLTAADLVVLGSTTHVRNVSENPGQILDGNRITVSDVSYNNDRCQIYRRLRLAQMTDIIIIVRKETVQRNTFYSKHIKNCYFRGSVLTCLTCTVSDRCTKCEGNLSLYTTKSIHCPYHLEKSKLFLVKRKAS